MFGQLLFITFVCVTVNAIPCSRCAYDWHCIPYLEHCNPTINATLAKNPRTRLHLGDCMMNQINPGSPKMSMQNTCQFNIIPLMGIYLVLFMILTCCCCCCCKCCCGGRGKRSSVGTAGRGDLVMVRA